MKDRSPIEYVGRPDGRPESTSGSESTSHEVAEQERLLRAQGYAVEIVRDPQLVELARTEIVRVLRSDGGTIGQRLWANLLDEPVDLIAQAMTVDSPEGRLLRSNNPFSTIIGCNDETERRRTRRKAKAILSYGSTWTEQSVRSQDSGASTRSWS